VASLLNTEDRKTALTESGDAALIIALTDSIDANSAIDATVTGVADWTSDLIESGDAVCTKEIISLYEAD